VSLKKIGLVVKADKKARRRADEFEAWLHSRGLATLRQECALPQRRGFGPQRDLAPVDLDCVFVMGGDGTFLSAARWIGEQTIPILGVKFGEVGFLAGTAEENLFAVAELILTKGFVTRPRMRLLVEVVREGRELACETVLNDVVINRGTLARLADIETSINDLYLTTYRADGLIVATPTGSTAYSLAAGGPVIHPQVPGIIMTPICPFTLTNRPLIVPHSACIKIRLEKKASDIMLTFDGQAGFEIRDSDTIIIRQSPHDLNLICIPGQDYFDVLKTKLSWSGGRI